MYDELFGCHRPGRRRRLPPGELQQLLWRVAMVLLSICLVLRILLP